VDRSTGKQFGARCPKLAQNRHGVWFLRQALPKTEDGKRRELRVGGYASAKKARKDLVLVQGLLLIPDTDDLKSRRAIADMLQEAVRLQEPFPTVELVTRRVSTGHVHNERTTVGEWLDDWLAGRQGIRRGSWRRYESIVRVHLKPAIGDIRLDRLDIHHLDTMFTDIRAANDEILESNALRRSALDRLARMSWKGTENRARRAALQARIDEMPPFRRITGPTSAQRIKSCLRAALNKAIASRKIVFNPASHVEIAPATSVKPLMWTPKRVVTWRRTGVVPGKVMVWTPELAGQFLEHVVQERLFAMWYVFLHYGLRRGEACGQPWDDTNLETSELSVTSQLVEDGWEVYESEPKTNSGTRTLAIDKAGRKVLRAHRERQEAEHEAAGDSWVDSGLVFTREDGSWLQPSWVTKELKRLIALHDLPPVSVHGLRHACATFALATGASMRTVQLLMGHSSIVVTQRYASVMEEALRTLAKAQTRLISPKKKKSKR